MHLPSRRICSVFVALTFLSCSVTEIDARAQRGNARIPQPWPAAHIPYRFAGHFPNLRALIAEAMSIVAESTCISFEEVSNVTQAAVIFSNRGATCWCSAVGYQGSNKHVRVNYGRGCVWRGRVMHELLHALGLRHEHSRPDRDLHIAVNWSNIKPGSRHHFQVDNGYTFLDIPYDFDSVMHYGRNAFAKNSSVGVLTALTSPARPLGGAVLSELDRRRLQVLYDCYNAMH